MYQIGEFIQSGSYRAFVPGMLSSGVHLDDPVIHRLLTESIDRLGRLDVYSKLIPDVDRFIMMHIHREAVASSRIEGTATSLLEALIDKDDIQAIKQDKEYQDWVEVRNYIKAINYAVDALREWPIMTRLLCNTHRILLQGARGATKAPGRIRQIQNQIGGSPTDPATATFVPPPPDRLPDLMSDLDKYWHQDSESLDNHPIIKSAVIHYQFETIHPFLDGNGRLGRLLIPLQLIESKILSQPSLYISDYFERNRQSYYDALNNVRSAGSINQWVRFFLQGIVETAEDGIRTMDNAIELRQNYLNRIDGIRSAATKDRARKLLDILFARPVVKVTHVEEMTKSSFATANQLIKKMVAIGILREITGYSRNRIFLMGEYHDIFAIPDRNNIASF